LKKIHILIIGIVLFIGFSAFVKIFPDPYHEEDGVTFFTWILREIDELLHGEKETPS